MQTENSKIFEAMVVGYLEDYPQSTTAIIRRMHPGHSGKQDYFYGRVYRMLLRLSMRGKIVKVSAAFVGSSGKWTQGKPHRWRLLHKDER